MPTPQRPAPQDRPWVEPTDEAVTPRETEVLLGESGPTEAGYHSIEHFMECPKKYQFSTIRGVHHPLHQNPDYFSVGSLFHAGRARWFSLRFSTEPQAYANVLDAMEKEADLQKLPVSHEAKARAAELVGAYIEHYSKRVRPKPVAAEYKIGPAPLKPNDPFFLFRTARLDDVSFYPEANNFLCIGESKTTSTSVADTVNQYELHGQTMLQAALWKMCPNGEAKYGPVRGIMLDVVKKPYGKEKAKFERVFVPVSDYAISWFVDSMRGYLKAAASIDWNAEVPRNASSCTKMIGRMRVPCEYRDLCRFGKSASAKYVTREGNSLLTWRPTAEQNRPPWE